MKLILHADDLGLHPAINKAVFEGADAGALTSASLMVNGRGTAEALDWAKQNPGFGIGLHLNILRGRPLSDPAKISSLVDAEGFFLNSASRLFQRSITGRLSAEEILAEYRIQLEYMQRHGVEPTHFDGEKHSHLFLKQAVWAVSKLMEESDINRLRLINESPLIALLKKEGVRLNGSLAQRLKLSFLEARKKQSHPEILGFKSTDYSFGILLSGRTELGNTKEILNVLLNQQENSTVEWMFHPGYPLDATDSSFTREFGQFFLSDARKRERAILLSPETTGILQKHKEKLITYREL